MKIALEHDEYWMASYQEHCDWMDSENERGGGLYYRIVDVDPELIVAERKAWQAWRDSVRAIYEAAGHGDLYG